MATLGSKLITKEMQWNANMTEQNHLGASLLAKPRKLVGVMTSCLQQKITIPIIPFHLPLWEIR